MAKHQIKAKVLEKIQAHDHNHKPQLIDQFNLDSDKKNQFLIFFKPETFLGRDTDNIEKVLDLAFDKFDEFGVELQGAALFPGLSLAEQQIMDRHYGTINYLSRNVSKNLTDEERQEIYDKLGTAEKVTILGGHEALELFKLTPEELEAIWLMGASTKIKSGFHSRLMEINGEPVILVNGFHPNQLQHFTYDDRHIVALVGHSDAAWQALREEMIGDTFPENALETSIRGKLNREARDFGFEKVDKTNNVIHFSAGPIEALFEIDNFLGKPFDIDIIRDNAKLAKELKVQGIMDELIRGVLADKDLHAETELKDTPEAIELITSRLKR